MVAAAAAVLMCQGPPRLLPMQLQAMGMDMGGVSMGGPDYRCCPLCAPLACMLQTGAAL